MSVLTGRVALITGASRGLGRAIAMAFAQAGADVALNYRAAAERAEEVRAAIEAMGRRVIAVQADVSFAEEVGRLVETTERALGAPAILVINAGIARPQPL